MFIAKLIHFENSHEKRCRDSALNTTFQAACAFQHFYKTMGYDPSWRAVKAATPKWCQNSVHIQCNLLHLWCINAHNMSTYHLFYFLLVGMSLRPARTTRLRVPMPVQAAHCTGVRGTVWNHFPPYCTITTCSHSGQSANEHQLHCHCYFLMQYSDV